MWFRSVFLKTLRDHRVAILGWGIGIVIHGYTVYFPQTATEEQIQREMRKLP